MQPWNNKNQTKKKVKNKPLHIGLFFGSFNPIHIGHLIVAKTALERTDLDELWFVVSPQNPFKAGIIDAESAADRLKMVELSITDEPRFFACDIEFDMPTPSYTTDTLKQLRKNNPGKRFSIVVGTDTQMDIESKWKDGELILDLHDLIVYPRGEQNTNNTVADKTKTASVYLTGVPMINISSTLVRENVRNKFSNKYIVLDAVNNYIKEHKLFL